MRRAAHSTNTVRLELELSFVAQHPIAHRIPSFRFQKKKEELNRDTIDGRHRFGRVFSMVLMFIWFQHVCASMCAFDLFRIEQLSG